MEYKIFVNGEFLPLSKAKISLLDTGFLFGYGLFETMRSYQGLVYKLSEHIKRLSLSASFLKIPLPYSTEKISQVVQKTLNLNNLDNAYIKIVLSGGVYSGKLSHPSTKPNFIVIVQPLTPYPDEWYTQGVAATIASTRRNPLSPFYNHKTLNFLENLLAKREARDKGCEEAIFLNTQGYLTEGCTANLFLVKKKKVITPSLNCGVLPGITRRVIIDLCTYFKIPCQEKKITLQELYQADEAFLTSSLREVLPLVRVDSKVIGEGKPGQITRFLIKEYRKKIKSHQVAKFIS